MEEKSHQVTVQFTYEIENGMTVSENHTGRFDTQAEEDKYREHALETAKSITGFPNDTGNVAHKPDATSTVKAPDCPIHGTPMKLRHGKYGDFWSCGTKNADGSWCNAKPTI